MAGRGDQTAHAANWRTVLLADLALGLLALGVGVAVLVRGGSLVLGGLLVAAGAAYCGLVVRRFLRWRRLRAGAVR